MCVSVCVGGGGGGGGGRTEIGLDYLMRMYIHIKVSLQVEQIERPVNVRH